MVPPFDDFAGNPAPASHFLKHGPPDLPPSGIFPPARHGLDPCALEILSRPTSEYLVRSVSFVRPVRHELIPITKPRLSQCHSSLDISPYTSRSIERLLDWFWSSRWDECCGPGGHHRKKGYSVVCRSDLDRDEFVDR
jgi:hypothetical protein